MFRSEGGLRFRLLVLMLCGVSAHAGAATIERQFKMTVTADGTQTWKNALQWSKGSTAQRYEIDTHLRSDGVLYADNLLDPDPQKRVAIKAEYLTLRGLRSLKLENGGKLPGNAKQLDDFATNAQAAVLSCRGDQDCSNVIAERFAAIAALQENSVEELEAYLEENEVPINGRFLYFFGYTACPTRLRLSYRSEVEGAQAFDKKKENLIPFRTKRNADMPGSAAEQASICKRYTATIDTKTGGMSIENAYIPSAVGITVSAMGDITNRKEESLPVPVQVLDWVSAQLRQAQDTGSKVETFRFTRPMDGNASLLGDFDGELKATLSWSFKQAQVVPSQKKPAK